MRTLLSVILICCDLVPIWRLFMHTRTRLPLALALCIAGAATCFAAHKASIDDALDSLYAVHNFKQVAISPDGKEVAWVESLAGGGSAIYVATPGSTEQPRRISAGDGKHGVCRARHCLVARQPQTRLPFGQEVRNSFNSTLRSSRDIRLANSPTWLDFSLLPPGRRTASRLHCFSPRMPRARPARSHR